MKQILPVEVIGHVKITDDLGEVLLDKKNSIHPQNMARVIARALANEPNHHIHAVAFGNGGTIVDAAYQITYKTPNDGQAPDTSEWKSRLYRETYREIVDESNLNIGSGSGSSPENDPPATTSSGPGVRSNEAGLISQVVVKTILNPFEPTGQTITDILSPVENTEDAFVFDEIGLFTTGSPLIATAGYQTINVGNKVTTDLTGLTPNTSYTFDIIVDNGTQQTIMINTGIGTGVGGQILFNDLVSAINTNVVGCISSISDAGGTINTFGQLKFTSNSTGSTSTINILVPTTPPANWLFNNITGFIEIVDGVTGSNQGVKNSPANPTEEGERMLTHLIFSPVRKSANRTLTVVYTLTVQVARSTS